MGKIRVLVVDDSAFMRKVVSDILSADPEIEVIDRARNGLECLEKVSQLQPDVITLDIEMPVMNGLEALERLMQTSPLPIVMLSSLTSEGADATIKALELGAFDFVTKPSGPISLDIHKVAEGLLEKVKAAAQAKEKRKKSPLRQIPPAVSAIRQPLKPTPSPSTPLAPAKQAPLAKTGGRVVNLVALGTSTGGPKALQTFLTSLPANLPAAIVIVQHMPAGFTRSLAQRLNSLCEIQVVEAEEGQTVQEGTAYIAPGGYHLEILQSGGVLRTHLELTEPRAGHRPAVDVLFESVSKVANVKKWAIIMTGMGSDGTKGLKLMKETGEVTSIIEDESTSVVFGMPRSAIQAGLADRVVPLDKIAETLQKLLN
ncbi:protein-glutamate methylesterase/protein-glutamine glutaminase [Brevibacillus fulvus]|uniref:Protein-glutamate methylesterase/protein-glutamine glutaminase n=1 Tax=Brevibacillus fulvus TaxID=1125967 RepID=A0A938Y2U3_9BACL|nr:chemotaxis response regulator protein-glutamate methylesterase [Brevibacillus fulvus]MBM7590607.1 two-component system chemotaxis response regulator CheB [Brevibacillus fulvus]